MATSPRLAGRYAKSLLSLAKEKNMLKEISADMHLLNDTISGNRDLQVMLKSPVILADKKEKVLTKIYAGNISDLTYTFITLLCKKGREKQLAEVASSFVHLYNKANHIATATLTTAVPASEEIVTKVRNLLLAIDGNESVEMTTNVDPKIVGGFVLHYGDKLLDASVQRKLHLIKKEIQDTSYINKI